MRAFENRNDTIVHDEPFYACYLKNSGAQHPMRDEVLNTQPSDWAVVEKSLSAPLPDGIDISFEKHIAFHFAENAPLHWVRETRVLQLIRDPRAMVASYKKKYGDISPIIKSFDVQRRVYDDCAARGVPCPIIDSKDILQNPEPMLRALCDALCIPFSEKMLSWPAGPRSSDGVWAPHWYDAVLKSTGFLPYREQKIELPDELEDAAALCEPGYQFLHKRRLKL